MAVFQEPFNGFVASFLAMLKVGALYVPLDPRTPTSRLTLIMNDSEAELVLVDSARLTGAAHLVRTRQKPSKFQPCRVNTMARKYPFPQMLAPLVSFFTQVALQKCRKARSLRTRQSATQSSLVQTALQWSMGRECCNNLPSASISLSMRYWSHLQRELLLLSNEFPSELILLLLWM